MEDKKCQEPEYNVPQKPLLYLACPYSHTDKAIQKNRFKIISKVAGQLVQVGNLVYSPITHTAPMAHENRMDTSYGAWLDLDEFYLSRCDIVIILTLDGWSTSEGIQKEIKFATDLNKPIIYLPYDLNTNV